MSKFRKKLDDIINYIFDSMEPLKILKYFLALAMGIVVIIFTLYYIGDNYFILFNTSLSFDGALGNWIGILSAVSTMFLGVVTISQTNKANDISKILLHKEILNDFALLLIKRKDMIADIDSSEFTPLDITITYGENTDTINIGDNEDVNISGSESNNRIDFSIKFCAENLFNIQKIKLINVSFNFMERIKADETRTEVSNQNSEAHKDEKIQSTEVHMKQTESILNKSNINKTSDKDSNRIILNGDIKRRNILTNTIIMELLWYSGNQTSSFNLFNRYHSQNKSLKKEDNSQKKEDNNKTIFMDFIFELEMISFTGYKYIQKMNYTIVSKSEDKYLLANEEVVIDWITLK